MPTALIVEDHRDQAELAAQFVRLRDFQPIVAEDGATGLELARSRHPDVVLLDLMLPDFDGFEVCRLLRSDRETLLTPVVMLTALNDDLNRRQGFWVGANAYVTKPYNPGDLYSAIASAIEWKHRLQQRQMQGEIHLELCSETTFLQDVNDFLTSLLLATPLKEDQIHHLRQAFMEMGQNAIEWGNRYRKDLLVRITYRIFADRIEIVIRDQGSGFNPQALDHAASPDDPLAHMEVREKLGLREGGFGMLITRGMVDELRYNEQGNEVTLIKRFPIASESALNNHHDAGPPPG